LFYLDPPYLHETRATTSDYAHEMTVDQHTELLNLLGGIRGRFLLSGYRSRLYDEAANAFGWTRHNFELPNNAAGGKKKRRMTECVWTNFKLVDARPAEMTDTTTPPANSPAQAAFHAWR
jgi:DNA adenine methylase